MLHGTLAVSERNLAKDRIYVKNKTSVNGRLKADELTSFIEKYTEEHGRKPDREEINAFADELEKKYEQFPIEVPL
jgi:DNA-directed RNA polymerase specialized sigma subunit